VWVLRGGTDVTSGDDTMISLEGFKGKLLQGLDPLLSHLLYFSGEHGFWGSGTVDTVGLDGDHNTSSDLQEQMGIQTDDTSLVRLGDICEDHIDHTDQHSVAERVTGILDDWDDVCAVGSHVDQISARSVRELNGENSTGWANDISNVGD